MFGTAYFIDGHSEPIIIYNFNPTQSELYFTTESGQYGFKEYIDSYVYDMAFTKQCFLTKPHSFYKYNNEYEQWFVVCNIERIEIYTEVLPNG